jgi:UDP-galactopyranose mutase
MPLHGYTCMFEKMLDHPNIKIMLNTDYREVQQFIPFREMIYTGPIDEFFDFRFGKLPYRSLEFKHQTLDLPVYQQAPVVNYPNEHPYTRITEFKYLTGQEHRKTSIVYEFPQAEGDPYYPVPRPENAELYRKYKALADETPGVHFVGRLATYRYYNMDQVTAQALSTFAKINGAGRSSLAEVVHANGNGHTNGNGHANGNGKVKVYMNGNGHTSGNDGGHGNGNGHANGNGHLNGNGNANDKVNGNGKANEKPTNHRNGITHTA